MNILIIGAGGIIGSALFDTFSACFSGCVGLTTRSAAPLATVNYDWLSLRPYITKSDIIIYCAGVTKFEDCERLPEKSLLLNVDLPQKIITSLSSNQAFVYFSSPIALYDFKDAAPVYALHKRKAEEALLSSDHEKCLIIRPAKVIESAGIVGEWKQNLSRYERIFAFNDQYIAPIDAATISEQVLRLIQGCHTGRYNFSAHDRLSYLDLAIALCAYFKLNRRLIVERSARTENAYFFEQDILDCMHARETIGYAPPASRDIIHKYFQKLAS